jgi:3-phenylpropionate/trans-cinnamate dioxygenase ferredoxin component
MTKWVDVAKPNEIPESEYKIVIVDDTPIAVFNLQGNFYAIQDNCPHQHLPLADGIVENNTITCPFHGAIFDIPTGEVLAPPACENLTTYQVRIHEGMIQVAVL